MNQLEDRRRDGYRQLAYYAFAALKVESEYSRREYQKKIGVGLCVLDGMDLLDAGDFILLQDLRYSDLECFFTYVNKKAGNCYEI